MNIQRGVITMTIDEAKKMLKAKLECLKHETSGTDYACNQHLCEGCSLNYEQGNMGEQKEALDMAIKALEQQPCEDCISREQAVYVASGYCAPQNIADELRKLPSVTPRTKSEEAIHAQGFVEGVKACIEKLNEMGG